MASCSGRLCFQGIEGRLHAESSHTFFPMILDHTPEHVLVIHEGARAHPSAATPAFWLAQSARLTAYPVPS
jgi:hypothetical protein